MKKCKRCNIIKPIIDFGKNQSKKDGVDIYCKKCNACKTKNRPKDKEKIKKYNSEYRFNNKESIKEYSKNYYLSNKETIKKRTSDYNKTDKSKEYKKIYREKNSKKISEYGKVYRAIKEDELREYFRIYRNEKRRSDILYRLRDQLRHRISESLKSKGFRKSNSTIDIIGCSIDELKSYMESKFEPWMTWENYGLYNGEINHGWDIDHIIPLSSANNEDDLIKLNHYTNLQPLCSYTNRYIKIDKIYEIS